MDKSKCLYQEECYRSGPDYPLVQFPLENRTKEIKAIVISQEPAAQRIKSVVAGQSDAVEIALRKEGKSGSQSHALIKQIQRAIGRPFDPYDDEIYWTHALKCIPKNDRHINKYGKDHNNEWGKCSRFCIDNLLSEFQNMPGSELLVIALGRYAVGATLTIVDDKKGYLKDPPKIHEFIGEDLSKNVTILDGRIVPRFKKAYDWNGKSIYLTAFRHGSNNNRRFGVSDELLKKVEDTEIEEYIFIREFLGYPYYTGDYFCPDFNIPTRPYLRAITELSQPLGRTNRDQREQTHVG